MAPGLALVFTKYYQLYNIYYLHLYKRTDHP